MQKIFDNLYKKAERTITSGTGVSKLLDEVFLKIGDVTESFYKIQDSIIALARMLSAWMKGDYKNISTENTHKQKCKTLTKKKRTKKTL